MLTRIDFRHFKCFGGLKLPLRPLTLLSGANASGKSTVLQGLALLHQTMREHEWSPRLMLNGTAVRLGTVADVIDQVQGRRECEIGLLDGDTVFRWTFTGEREGMSMDVARLAIAGTEHDRPTGLRHLLPSPHGDGRLAQWLRTLTYLTAERLGPRETYPLEDPQGAPVVGPRGEHTVSVLHAGRDDDVPDRLRLPGVPGTRLRQVEARMARFFPGCGLEVREVVGANAALLGLRTSNDMDFHRPAHTGFGLTQVLPIVVAALSADRDGLLLIENPEVHLHPAGQAAMGKFLAEVAAAGVQVLLETHSDHVLNGIRRAVRDGTLSAGDAAVHFFRPCRDDGRGGGAQVQSPALDEAGNLDSWPDGFFDQFDKDMNYFAGWS